MMTVSSNTVSLFVLLALLSTISGSWINIYNGDFEKSPSGGAVNSLQETPGVCGVRPYDYLFDESRQRSVHDALLRNVVDDLKTQKDQKNIKIVGGNIAVHGEFPWQARTQLLHRNGEIAYPQDCGAAVISEHWLLSAGHCFRNWKKKYDVRIIVGDHSLEVNDDGEQAFDVERIIKHEKFTPDYDYDIALIKIRPTSDGRGIQFNSFVQPACLPDSTTPNTEGTECLVSGWGSVKQDIPPGPPVLELYPILLQGAKVPLIHQTVCKYMYSVSTPKRNVTERMICAGYVDGGVDACQGDSGGPLVSKIEGFYTLYGLTSWGLGCAAPKLPGVYARVSEFLPWIKSNINAYSENTEQGTLPSKPSMNQDDESSEESMSQDVESTEESTSQDDENSQESTSQDDKSSEEYI